MKTKAEEVYKKCNMWNSLHATDGTWHVVCCRSMKKE